jgi:hypothetical protein
MTEKIDLFKELKAEYKAKPEPAIVQTTKAQYLSIEGKGDPNGKSFQEAIGALYAMAFTVKMTRKAEGLGDYVVGKLESQWFSDEDECFANLPKEKWQWVLMIRTPDCVKKVDLTKALKAIISKGKCEHPVDKVTLIKLNENECVQALHVGPYEKVGETIDTMVKFIQTEDDYTIYGRYHEIYLSDPRRIPPERLKTIIRFPVTKK